MKPEKRVKFIIYYEKTRDTGFCDLFIEGLFGSRCHDRQTITNINKNHQKKLTTKTKTVVDL